MDKLVTRGGATILNDQSLSRNAARAQRSGERIINTFISIVHNPHYPEKVMYDRSGQRPDNMVMQQSEALKERNRLPE